MLLNCGKPLIFFLVVFTLVQCKRRRVSHPMARINPRSKARGYYDTSENSRVFRSFTGIPYAQPPIGNLRFKPPEPSQGWVGIYNATHDPPMCLQTDINFSKQIMAGQEDCLYLNVYAPTLSRKYRIYYPVMVFIHGPTFFSGSSTLFRPHRFLDQDVVLVTFNYRLGIFGFLSTEDEHASGNWGLLDQVVALKWVQENIASFGGDPSRITLFGQGAGAHAVSLHQFSSLSKGLFHSAIIQSDSFLCPSRATYDPLTNTRLLAREVNCPHNDRKEMIHCLRRMNSSHFFHIFDSPSSWEWQPRVDSESATPFLPTDPKNLINTTGPLNPVPVIVGASQAYLLVHGSKSIFGRLETFEPSDGTEESKLHAIQEFVSFILFTSSHSLEIPEKEMEALMKEITNIYFPNLQVFGRKVADLYADAHYNPCLYETARLLSRHEPTWLYSFDHIGNKSFSDNDGFPTASVFWDELLYLFPMVNFSTNLIPRDSAISSVMIELLTNFARYENPTPHGNYLNINWSRVANGRVPYLRIREPLKLEPDFHSHRMHFWLKKINKY